MDSNVLSFDSFESDQQIAAHQAGLVRVVLEGDTDVELFSRFWFQSLLETFEFIEARKVAAGGAGCTGVDDAVVHSRQQGIPAVGIVDRDTLFRSKEWQLLFSVGEAQLAADWRTTRIYVTSRWEVEAYLLEADMLAPWVTVAHRDPPGSPAECERALARTLEECRVLLAASPFFASQHEGGDKVSPSFLFDEPLERVLEVCNLKIASSAANAQAVAVQVQQLVTAILATQPGEGEQRLPFLLRYVDTKRLFKRLQHALKLRDVHWVTLAQHMLTGQRRPTELEQVLRSVAARFAV
jgi:hypothetical protein